MCFCIDLLSFWWIIFATSKFQKAASRHPVCALSASDLAFFLTRPLDCDGATAAAMTRRPTRRRVNCAAFFFAPRISLLSLSEFSSRGWRRQILGNFTSCIAATWQGANLQLMHVILFVTRLTVPKGRFRSFACK